MSIIVTRRDCEENRWEVLQQLGLRGRGGWEALSGGFINPFPYLNKVSDNNHVEQEASQTALWCS